MKHVIVCALIIIMNLSILIYLNVGNPPEGFIDYVNDWGCSTFIFAPILLWGIIIKIFQTKN